MLIEQLVVGPLDTNCYLVADDNNSDLPTAVIYPGAEPARIEQKIRKLNLKPVFVLNTHGHFDHTLGVEHLSQAFGAKYLIHKADAGLEDEEEELMELLRDFAGALPPKPDSYLSDSDELGLGKLKIKVIHTPGHTPGGVCFLIEDALFTGDTLFAGGVGRTDLPGGSTETLLSSINRCILILDNNVRVLPGHGPESTIAIEKATNPWLVGSGGYSEP